MTRWRVNVGTLVPHTATIIVEARHEAEAHKRALAQAWDHVPGYLPEIENSGPLQVFDVARALPSEKVTYPDEENASD